MEIYIKLLVLVFIILNNGVTGARTEHWNFGGSQGTYAICESTNVVNSHESFTFDQLMRSDSAPSQNQYDQFELMGRSAVEISAPSHGKRGNVEKTYLIDDDDIDVGGSPAAFLAARSKRRGNSRIIPPTLYDVEDYTHNTYDNPEMRIFNQAPSILPDHSEDKVPKKEIKKDMIAGLRRLKGESEGNQYRNQLPVNAFSQLRKHVERHPRPSSPTIEKDDDNEEKINEMRGLPSENRKEPQIQGKNSNLPSYIQHILNKRNPDGSGAAGAGNNRSSSSSSLSNPNSGDNNNPDGNSLQDILGNLGPEKLNQLRQLLATTGGAAADAGGGGVPADRTRGQRRGFTGLRPKRSIDDRIIHRRGPRSRSYGGAGQSERCSWEFKKGQSCKRFVVWVEDWADRVEDCGREFLQISDGTTVKKYCAGQRMNGGVSLNGDRVTIIHYKASAHVGGSFEFKGYIKCE